MIMIPLIYLQACITQGILNVLVKNTKKPGKDDFIMTHALQIWTSNTLYTN